MSGSSKESVFKTVNWTIPLCEFYFVGKSGEQRSASKASYENTQIQIVKMNGSLTRRICNKKSSEYQEKKEFDSYSLVA